LPLVLVSERHTPWLLWQPGQGFRVRGQLFDVDAAALAAMDELEGVDDPDGYRRMRLLVQEASDDAALPIEAQGYLKQPAQLRGQALQSGPHAEYTLELAASYRMRSPTRG
jgi:gamma-glutamylaminecyclotransferase